MAIPPAFFPRISFLYLKAHLDHPIKKWNLLSTPQPQISDFLTYPLYIFFSLYHFLLSNI